MENIISGITNVNSFLTEFIGFQPLLMVIVFILVSIVSRALSIRSRYPDDKNWILGLICLAISILVSLIYLDEFDWRELGRMSLRLGSLSAFTYQIFKKFFKSFIYKIVDLFQLKTGQDVDIEDDDFI